MNDSVRISAFAHKSRSVIHDLVTGVADAINDDEVFCDFFVVAADGVFVDKTFNRGQIERFAYVCRNIDKVEFRAVNVDFAGGRDRADEVFVALISHADVAYAATLTDGSTAENRLEIFVKGIFVNDVVCADDHAVIIERVVDLLHFFSEVFAVFCVVRNGRVFNLNFGADSFNRESLFKNVFVIQARYRELSVVNPGVDCIANGHPYAVCAFLEVFLVFNNHLGRACYFKRVFQRVVRSAELIDVAFVVEHFIFKLDVREVKHGHDFGFRVVEARYFLEVAFLAEVFDFQRIFIRARSGVVNAVLNVDVDNELVAILIDDDGLILTLLEVDCADVEFVFESGILIVFDCVNDVRRQLEAVTVDNANAVFYERIEHPFGCFIGFSRNIFGLCFAVFVLAVLDIACAVFLVNDDFVFGDFLNIVIIAVLIDSVNTGDFRTADIARGNVDSDYRFFIFQDVVIAVISDKAHRNFAIGISADVDICRLSRACEQFHVVAVVNAAERITADLERLFVVERLLDFVHLNRDGFGRYGNRRFDDNVCRVVEIQPCADEFESVDFEVIICAGVLAGQDNRAVFERDVVRALQSGDLERAVDRVRQNRIFAVIDL